MERSNTPVSVSDRQCAASRDACAAGSSAVAAMNAALIAPTDVPHTISMRGMKPSRRGSSSRRKRNTPTS
jgi:hypothetical protein